MKKLFLFIIILLGLPAFKTKAVTSFSNENLHYVITYKWGMIHKETGEATLSLNRRDNFYNIMLSAKTRPWADKIYQVRDTLKGVIRVSDLRPVSYTKLTHEKGKYKKDEITYSINGNSTTGNAKRYRTEKGKMNVTEKTFSASGPVFDMISIFYFLRNLDFDELNKNKIFTATIFSGKQKETIKIRSLGLEKIKLKDKTERQAYHIRFNFTREGGKKSSDDMDTWISTDARHIPLYLTGKLPIGEVRAYYTGG